MALVSFKNLGAKGIITDVAPNELPLDAWSRGTNVRFTPLGVERTLGHRYVGGTPATEPLQAFYTLIGDTVAWSYWGTSKAYTTDGVSQYDISRIDGGDYSANATHKWNGGNFNGLVIANNGVDVPQVWAPTSFFSTAQNLPNWPSELRAQIIRPFGSYLVAMNLTDYGLNKSTALRWSHPADPGSVPISWDISDETKDAGEWYLNESMGDIVDLVSLRGDALIYKTDSIHRMQLINGTYIFKFSKISSTLGMPVPRCSVSPNVGTHIFWTGDDVVMTDGVTFKSIIDSRCRKRLQNVSDDTLNAAFMVNHINKSEVWLCLSEEDNNPTRATTAFVYNLNTNAWGIRSLGTGANFIHTGPIVATPEVEETWETIGGTWDLNTRTWDDSLNSRSTNRLLGGMTEHITLEDSGVIFEDAYYESSVERIGFGIPFDQNQPPDISTWKFCREIWPRISGTAGTQVEITIGSMSEISDTVAWAPPQIFTVGTDVKVNCTVSGRMFAIRFRSVGGGVWTLHGYDLEVNRAGGY